MRFIANIKSSNMTDEKIKGEENMQKEKMKNQIVSKVVNLVLELDYCNNEELKEIDDMFNDITKLYHIVNLDDYENTPAGVEAEEAIKALDRLTNRVYKK